MKKFYFSLIAALGVAGTAVADDYTVVGNYDLTIQPTDMMGVTSGDPVTVKAEVRQSGDAYCIAETGTTDYFKGYTVPFTYNDASKLATFDAAYVGPVSDAAYADSPYLWFCAFVFSGFTEPQPTYAVKFAPATGFEFPEANDAGFAWFCSDSATEFNPWDVYNAFYVYGTSESGSEPEGGEYGDASIEGAWQFTLDGHYLGSFSLGEFSETFIATLDGNTVTFESTGSQYNIVAEFTAENTLTFKKALVGSPESTYGLWQSPYVNKNGADDLEDLTEESFTAVYNSFNGTLTFPEGSGLEYGYFNNATGDLSYWDDAFDFVAAKKDGGQAPTPDFGDASIEGEWNFTLDGHYLGEYSLGEFTEAFVATLAGNTVTFESTGSQYNIVAEFVAENTLKFNFCPVGPQASYTLYQSPYINFEEVNDIEELTEQSFVATYVPAEGKIVFPEYSGLRYGYFTADGDLSYWDDAFDFVSASRSVETEVLGQYSWTIQPTNIYGSKLGEMVSITVEVRKSGDVYGVFEVGGTNYLNNTVLPFTYYEDAEYAQFTACYAGVLNGEPAWMSAFVYNEGDATTGSFIEAQENFGVGYNVEEGFSFTGESGFAWFSTSSADDFDAQGVISAFYVVPMGGSAVSKIESATNGEAVYYDLQGRRVNNPKGSLYIMKSGDTVKKVMLPK